MTEPIERLVDEHREGWPLLPVLGLVALAWMLLGWPWLTGRVTIPWDAKAHFQPQIQFLAQSLWRGESPMWAPFAFSGQLQAADPQSMIFSPPFLALAAVDPNPGLHAVDTTVLLAILLGAFAIVVWFRDNGWHWAGAALAALAFAFGASMAWRILNTGQVLSLVYLAIVVTLLSRALARSSWRYGLAAGVAAAFLVLGRDQVALLAVYLLIGYVASYWLGFVGNAAASTSERIRHSLAPLLAGGMAGLAIVTLPVLMTLLVAEQSNRPAIDFIGAGRGSLHPALFITFLAPDVFGSSGAMAEYWGPPSFTWTGTDLFIAQNMGQLYIGAVPVLLLVLGLVTGTLWRREIRFFLLALIATTIYALGWYTPVFKLLHAYLPGVDFYRRPADATFLIGYLAAVLAGYSAHRLLAEPLWQPSRRALLMTVAVPAIGFAAAAYFAVSFDRVGVATAPFVVALALVAGGGLAIALARHIEPLRPIAAGLVLVAYTVGDLAWSNGPGGASALPPEYYAVLEPTRTNATIALLQQKVAETASPTRRDRIELIGLGFHWPNASLTHRLENTLGYNPVRLAHYARATGAGDTSGGTGDRQFTPLLPSYHSPLANLLGLRFIASGVPIGEIDKRAEPHLKLLARTADAYIYENPDALPRVLYATSAKQVDFEQLIEKGRMNEDFTRTVLLERPSADPQSPRRPGHARIVRYTNTEIEIEAEGEDGGFVVLNDIWHPWWRASIDGAPAPLLRANVIFRAVEVEPGRHRVRFHFEPFSGALASLRQKLTAAR